MSKRKKEELLSFLIHVIVVNASVSSFFVVLNAHTPPPTGAGMLWGRRAQVSKCHSMHVEVRSQPRGLVLFHFSARN